MNDPLRPETLAAQAGGAHDPATGAVVPPLQPASTYARGADYRLPLEGVDYGRDANPTYRHAERVIAALEGGAESLLFASGMAAIAAVFQALEPGARVVAPVRMYHGALTWLKAFSEKMRFELALYDPASPENLAAVVGKRVDLVWVETPANPGWEVTDIARAATATHAAGGLLAVDNTVPTPVHTRPLELGADVVVHSATKSLNGHSDLTAGAVVLPEDSSLAEGVRFWRKHGGAVPGPFEAWLLLRGLRTLFVRVQRASATALTLARHFEGHPQLTRVRYPGLDSDPGHAVAARQMRDGFGAMLSLQVRGGAAEARAVAGRLNVFLRATSLGGVESLVEHRKSVEGPDSLTPENLLRLSVGLEAPQDLIDDLERALD